MNTVQIKPYHHGDLHQALILAALEVIAERGVAGFSLRETARRAGVSPGAPSHHFKDARGLLTAIAKLAFDDLALSLLAAQNDPAHSTRNQRLMAQGHAYIDFAINNPTRFALMWRKDLLDCQNQDYCQASLKAYFVLYDCVMGTDFLHHDKFDFTEFPKSEPNVIAVWALVHGYAELALSGAFDPNTPDLLDPILRQMSQSLTLA